VQREALAEAGVRVAFEEEASGTKRDNRQELSKVLSILGKGDTLVVTRLDRLGRSLKDLADIAHEIEKAGANLKGSLRLSGISAHVAERENRESQATIGTGTGG
jgi:DNA invertase Pin-like site-specific DNA recombinase